MPRLFPKEILVPAALWKRVIAYIIDSFIMGIFIGLPFERFFQQASSLKGAYDAILNSAAYTARFAIAIFFLSVLVLAYWSAFEYRFGQSIGKMAMKIKVRAAGGSGLSLQKALLRNVSKISSLLLALDCSIYMLLTRQHQRWLEKLSGTEVVESI